MDAINLLETAIDSLDFANDAFGDVARVENQKCVAVQNSDEDRKKFIDKIISRFLRHNWTFICLEDVMDLLNENREVCDKFPTNKQSIMKLFSDQRNLFDVFFFVKCAKCKLNNKIKSDNSGSNCVRCNNVVETTETNFFVTIPIEQQIKKSVVDNWKFISKFDTSGDTDSQCYTDAHDGKILKEVLKKYADSEINILSFCLNLDGANKFNSNDLSVWPIQLLQNYLPPSIRFLPNNIIVSGLHYNNKKPNCHEFMLPLINELNELNGRKITIEIDGETYIFMPVITHCSVDLPAKSMLQATKQFGSYNGCTYCDIPGELVTIPKSGNSDDEKSSKKKKGNLTKSVPDNTSKKPKQFVRYVEGDHSPKLRSEVETLKTMLAVSESTGGEAVDGVKDVSCLVSLPHFNIVYSVGLDYMHAVLLGTEKRTLNFFCNSRFHAEKYYITPKHRKSLNAKLLAIKPTSNITRKPRSLDQRKNFKASEFRSLLLYYLPVCLPGSTSNIFVEHIRLLSGAVYMLLKTNISQGELEEAEKMLHKFVKDHQVLFGKHNMVMVIHLLKHLSNSVEHLGPLWCHSAFAFERNNGCLLKTVNGTTNVLHQMSFKYTLLHSLPSNVKSGKAAEKLLLGKEMDIVEEYLKAHKIGTFEKVDLSNVPLSVYKRIKLNNVIYTSLLYTRPKKSVDYFIGLKDGTVGMARFYFKFEDKICVLMEEFKKIDNIYHIDKVVKTKVNVLAPIEDIVKKFIFMKVGLNEYIASPPNPYEKE